MANISGKTDPVVREIKVADVAEALAQGFRDFRAAPLSGLAIGALYAGFGIPAVTTAPTGTVDSRSSGNAHCAMSASRSARMNS